MFSLRFRGGVCVAVLALLGSVCLAAQSPKMSGSAQPAEWVTNQGRTELLSRHTLSWEQTGQPSSAATTITVDPSKSYQTVDGFGFAMTGGSAQLLHRMNPAARHTLLQQIFGRGPGQMGVSYLRVSIGASDMNDHVFTYDDVPSGQTDATLQHFSLAEDETDLLPVMREVLAIAPHLQILATPWTAPSWMKTNGLPKAGNLKTELYLVYANYLVRYLQQMSAEGVTIQALTIQNEPLNPKNTPSMIMEAPDEAAFLQDALGPALRKAGLKTKVILFDHNCNHPDYPETVLRDPQAAQYAAGSGFHLYEGDISAMTEVHDAFPAKDLYFTEQMVVEHTRDGVMEPVAQPVSRIVIGAMRNWSRSVLLWNLAADASFGPHTNEGGCPVCQGAITIEGDKVERNIALYTIAHVSEFVPAGSVRIDSSAPEAEFANVAFRRPDGRFVLLATNTGEAARSFVVQVGARQFSAKLEPGSVGTFVW